MNQTIENVCINTIRTLSMDAVQKANSGHPGTAMALAPVIYCLWQRFLQFNPDDPAWLNRDRFVLSAGHASMLLYSTLHLCAVKALSSTETPQGKLAVPLEEIKEFRQLHSLCPGHPEFPLTSGVETTTGPLGQGAATSVGMAIASRWLGEVYNRPGFTLFDFDVYALCGDGCMMEGITGEAASLAGHLGLSNLCWIYDSNRITIEGHTDLAFSEDVATRFAGYGWQVTRVHDANDLEKLHQAFSTFKQNNEKPTLIIVESHIAFGAPHKQDSHTAHGEPLGEEEIALTKRRYGWPENAKFLVPPEVLEHFREGIGMRGHKAQEAWKSLFQEYRNKFPDLATQLDQMRGRTLPDGWDNQLPTFVPDTKGIASREASGTVLNAIAETVPWLIGGSADLAPSTKTLLKFDGAGHVSAKSAGGRNFHFGVREHAMGAVLNGLSLSKIRPYGAGFLIFSDYMRPAIRLSALMELPIIYIFTHDSIGVGEDGPTHQPIEHLASLRAMPGLLTIRPADAEEVREAWKVIMPLQREPVALILSRQALPTIDRTTCAPASGLARGAYILADTGSGNPDVILIGTGSEVSLCLQAYQQLASEGIAARVVSMPSWELFERQDQDYRESILPPAVAARVSVEQGATTGWERYTGSTGHVLGMKTFGASAPLKSLQQHFGFTLDRVLAAAKEQLSCHKSIASS